MNNMVIISCILDQSLDQKKVTGTVHIEKLKFQISTIQLNIVLCNLHASCFFKIFSFG